MESHRYEELARSGHLLEWSKRTDLAAWAKRHDISAPTMEVIDTLDIHRPLLPAGQEMAVTQRRLEAAWSPRVGNDRRKVNTIRAEAFAERRVLIESLPENEFD